MPDTADNQLGVRVRQLREERGWSQSELAQRLPNVRQQSIDQLEQGKVRRPRFLHELAQALGTTVNWLMSGKGGKARMAATPAMADVDVGLLKDVLLVVEKIESERKLKFDHAHKAKLIGAIYELMLHEETQDIDRLHQAAHDIISYDQIMQKRRG